jgi:hypothetical protein
MTTTTHGRTPRLAALALTLTLALVAGAPAAQAATGSKHHHARHHGKSPDRRHRTSHAVKKKAARAPARPTADGAKCVPGGDQANPEKTVQALRTFSGNEAQFDDVFRCLAQYPTVMPGWDVAAKGWVRLAPDAGPADQAAMQALLNVWQGKHWYTHPDGGTIYNRMFDDRQAWNHRVTWTPTTLVDKQPAIFVDASPVPGVDNIRMVQPGIYLGITMTDGVKPIWGPDSTWTVPRGLAHGFFILDFLHTQITKDECPACTPDDHKGP